MRLEKQLERRESDLFVSVWNRYHILTNPTRQCKKVRGGNENERNPKEGHPDIMGR